MTIRTHIAIHCVANKKPDPLKHRKLYLNPDGTYRLYWSRDAFHPERKSGKTLPDANRIPAKYHDLLGWYRGLDAASRPELEETDPILALRGIGKDLWGDLGGGEKFIRDLRANWYGGEMPVRGSIKAKPPKRKRAV